MTTQTDNEMALTEEMISTRAYQRYAERGGEDGHDVEDWLIAEEDLRTNLATRPAETTSALRASEKTRAARGTARELPGNGVVG